MATEAQLRASADNGRDWTGLCQALVRQWCDQFGHAPVTYPSALDAYYASTIVSADCWNAPAGAFLYYAGGPYGHVNVHVDNDREGMASNHVTELWAIAAGEVDLGEYCARTGMEPLGWSHTNGANDFTFEPAAGIPPAPEEEPAMPVISTVSAAPDGRNRRVFVVAGTGWYYELLEAGADYGAPLQEAWDTGAPVKLTTSAQDALIASAERINAGG